MSLEVVWSYPALSDIRSIHWLHEPTPMPESHALQRPAGEMSRRWELVDEGNATYLFRPRDRMMGKHLFDWLRDPMMRRQDLLESKDLQVKIGFVRRVIHRDAGEPLDAWSARICEALGRPPGADGRP